jgi:hypothetical protein
MNPLPRPRVRPGGLQKSVRPAVVFCFLRHGASHPYSDHFADIGKMVAYGEYVI